jgi:N-methylhydantoinase A
MLDIHTVGAGGGSIAVVDAGGSLRVGPESAGASPGPACYGAGDKATVTDAHVVLGRIAARQLIGGGMPIDAAAAESAVAKIAAGLGLDTIGATAAILRVANSNMERAIRAVSVERGEDPREFPLVAFGGCGGLHACEIAEELGIATVIVPRLAGALSALGMLLADRTRDYSVGALGVSDHEIRFRKLEKQAAKDVRGATLQRFADVRYAGQSYELTIPWNTDFHKEHRRIYGYSDPGRPTQIVTLRVRATVHVEKPSLRAPVMPRAKAEVRRVFIDGRWREIPASPRESLGTGTQPGPALIADYGSTALVRPGWSMRQDRAGSLILHRAV